MSYRTLRVWQVAREVSVEIHRMTIHELPRFEMFEEGAQIRRSSKSIRSNLVEGHSRRRYKLDFIRFPCLAESSCDETIDHLETLVETGSLQNTSLYNGIHGRLQQLARMIHGLISAVEKTHDTSR